MGLKHNVVRLGVATSNLGKVAVILEIEYYEQFNNFMLLNEIHEHSRA